MHRLGFITHLNNSGYARDMVTETDTKGVEKYLNKEDVRLNLQIFSRSLFGPYIHIKLVELCNHKCYCLCGTRDTHVLEKFLRKREHGP